MSTPDSMDPSTIAMETTMRKAKSQSAKIAESIILVNAIYQRIENPKGQVGIIASTKGKFRKLNSVKSLMKLAPCTVKTKEESKSNDNKIQIVLNKVSAWHTNCTLLWSTETSTWI